ncbi:putative protein farnesyltransferase [Rosa chinensis]|uniref:Prenyltransferase alpha-alpha toroid domain-containing protein n=1 Tax=Rosa chinensis TaxID=74649 RepID=A0A2P6S5E4_ROSCH|nr:putative protein farnesyltransferase [Rosa chinensis]
MCPLSSELQLDMNFINRRVEMKPLFHAIALKRFYAHRLAENNGGLIDKPGKSRDFYHTCFGSKYVVGR